MNSWTYECKVLKVNRFVLVLVRRPARTPTARDDLPDPSKEAPSPQEDVSSRRGVGVSSGRGDDPSLLEEEASRQDKAPSLEAGGP